MTEVTKQPTICLQMIVKDEGHTLEKAIKSIKDICDEIVIGIDNSSSDNSEEIARKYATDVWKFDFENDFSDLRNRGLERTNCDWNIVIDGHEYFEDGHDDRVRKVINFLHDKEQIRIVWNNVVFELDEFGHPMHVGGGQRILRKGVYYKRAQHNYPHPGDDADPNGHRFHAGNEILLYHDKPEVREAPRRDQRNRIMPEFMMGELEKDPNDRRSIFYMNGHHYANMKGSGDKANKFHLEKCIEFGEMYLDRCPAYGPNKNGDPDERYQIIIRIVQCYGVKAEEACANNDIEECCAWYEKADEILHECHRLNEGRSEHLVWLGHTAFKTAEAWGKIEKNKGKYIAHLMRSELHLKKALVHDIPKYTSHFIMVNFYTWVPWYQLGLVYLAWNRFKDSVDCFDKALEIRPRDEEIIACRDMAIKGFTGKIDEQSKNLQRAG